jgi:cyclic 2,3-diphosphoglycerate synthetase
MTRTIVLVDGEHYPDVVRDAIVEARGSGHEVVAAVWAGGGEKIGATPPDLGVPVLGFGAGPLEAVLRAAVEQLDPEIVLDLSDEPVLGMLERLSVADLLMALGVAYGGSDFRFDPVPSQPVPGGVASLAVVGSGKRTGKTAVAQEVVRTAMTDGLTPVVVAMGRGGPAEPEVVEAGSLTLPKLLEISRSGRHAASDHLEDAFLTGATTIGARRAGGGFAGAPFSSNVGEAVRVGAARRPDLLVLEGSGAAAPPFAAGATILVVPAHVPPEVIRWSFGRRLRADLVVVTMADSPVPGRSDNPLGPDLLRALEGTTFIPTEFHPEATAEVKDRDAFFTTTASPEAAALQAEGLRASSGCRIVGWSSNLADRSRLERDLEEAPGYDVLLTELKAAAVDVAAERAVASGAEVVAVANRVRGVEGDVVSELRALIRVTRTGTR